MHFNKIKYTIALFCLAISGFFTVSSCTHEPDKVEIKVPEPLPPCDPNKVYFVNDVMPYISEPIGNILFAGEHCSSDFQGFMNGGAQTGKEVAMALLKKIKTA